VQIAVDVTAAPGARSNPLPVALAASAAGGDPRVRLSLPRATRVHLAVFDLRGRRVRNLLDGELVPAGDHDIDWDGRSADGRSAASGVYLVRVSTPAGAASTRVSLIR
jgi:flagellar hook assembly protein FlgD